MMTYGRDEPVYWACIRGETSVTGLRMVHDRLAMESTMIVTNVRIEQLPKFRENDARATMTPI